MKRDRKPAVVAAAVVAVVSEVAVAVAAAAAEVVVVMAAEVAVAAAMAAAAADTVVNAVCDTGRTDNAVVRPLKTGLKYCLCLGWFLLLAACGNLSVENYDKLKVGMAYEEVKKILGPPAKCSDVLGVKHCRWGDEQRHIDVNFIGDQVLIFSAENIR